MPLRFLAAENLDEILNREGHHLPFDALVNVLVLSQSEIDG